MKLALGPILKKRNIKQTELADMTGFTRGYISGLVSGKKTPSSAAIAKIMDALGVGPEELLILHHTPRQTPSPNKSPRQSTTASPARAAGLEESGVEFAPKSDNDAESFEELAGHHARMIASADHLPLAILSGDILHVDLSQKNPNGQIAIVTRANVETGNAVTVLRRVAGDIILPLYPNELPTPMEAVDFSHAILGVVIGVERAL